MEEKDKNKIRKGIAAYHHEQKVLLRLIKMSKGLTTSKFDKIFYGRDFKRRLFGAGVTGDSYVLGMGQNGGTQWSFYLDLLQHMVMIGLVDIKQNKNNEMMYVLSEEV